jgi:CRP/FNR family transcriptional regulator, cAMP and macrophage regulator
MPRGTRFSGAAPEQTLCTGTLFEGVSLNTGTEQRMSIAQEQHLAWLARSFGRPDYLPLTNEDVETLRSVAEPISRLGGSHLFKEGEPAAAAYLIESGQVDLYRLHNTRPRVVARVGPGSVIGDIAMFGEGTYMSSARAVGRVKAFRFEREVLLPELAERPALCLRWLVAGLRQLQHAQRRIVHLMHKTVLAQVADLLVEESERNAGAVELSQAAIAALLGASRQTVNEAIGTLRELGAIETGYRKITVVDADLLCEVAAGDDRRTPDTARAL